MQQTASEKTILITGASSGIGYALALGYLEKGNRVVVMARSKENLTSLVEIYPNTLSVICVDLSDAEDAQIAGRKLESLCSQLNLVILNAGTCEYIDLDNFSLEPFLKVMAINWQGVLHTLAFALPLLVKAAHAKVPAQLVGMSSLASCLPMPRAEAYGASKVALEYLLNSLRVDLWGKGIDVVCVRPGFVKTPLTDRNDFIMPFMVSPERAADIIMRGISRRKLTINFPFPLAAIIRFVALLPLRWQSYVLQKIRPQP